MSSGVWFDARSWIQCDDMQEDSNDGIEKTHDFYSHSSYSYLWNMIDISNKLTHIGAYYLGSSTCDAAHCE